MTTVPTNGLFKLSKTARLWPPRADLKYWAFVSYTGQDRRQARRLHAGLERYRFPKDLVGSVTRKGLHVPERLYPCYLDVEELGAEPALTDPLMRALDASLTLAVVCSPAAASAPWVEREIAHFSQTTASETEARTIHAWIVAGDVPRCFPPSFRAKEPAACNVGKRFAFQREVVRLAAAVVGLDPAALWQRERARRRKRLAMSGLAATLVIATLAGLAVSAIRQNQRAESLRLASSSEAAGNPVDALRLGLSAVRTFATDQAERALSRALSIQRTRAILEHSTSVYVGEFSPEGTLSATGTEDGTVALWTVATGQAHTAFKGHLGNVEDLAFSPSGRWLASVGTDATVRMWDSVSLASASTYSYADTEINRVGFTSEETFVTGSANGLVQGWTSGRDVPIWSYRAEPGTLVSAPSPDGLLILGGASSEVLIAASTGTLVRRLRRSTSVKVDSSPITLPKPVFSPNGKWAAAGDPAGAVRVWDVVTGRLMREIRRHTAGINRLSWAPDSKRLATASEDGLAFVIDVESGDTLGELKHSKAVEDVAFSRNGYILVTAGDDNRAIVWSWTGEPRYELLGHRAGVWRAAFSPDGTTIATVSLDNTARLWSTVSGRERTIITHPARVDEVVASGTRLLVKGDRHLAVLDPLTGRTSASKSTPRSFRSMSVAVHPGVVALQSRDNIVQVLDLATLTERCATPRGNPAIVHRIALSADGTTLLVAGAELSVDPYRNVLQLWDATTCTFVRTVAQLPADALGVLFAPTGKTFVAWLQRPFLLFGPSPDDASLLPAPDRFQITRAALSADGQRLATAREGSVDIWDVTGKRQLETIAKQSTRANPIVFFPNRSVLLSADEFGRLAAVPLGSSAAEPPLLMDTKYAANVAVSASGRFYATSQGSTTTVWDAETGLVRHDLAGSHPAFLDIDTSILTFEDDKVLVYDLRLDALTDAATHRAPIIAVTKRDQP